MGGGVNVINFLEKPSLYEFVDLGLPSGLKWATFNVGATKPEEYGLYFAWGETEGYSGITDAKSFSWSDYKFSNDSSGYNFSKYNNNSASGTVDNLTTLEVSDDAAYQTDSTCRIPTHAEFQELFNTAYTEYKWDYTKSGYTVTSLTNNNTVFFPAAGYCGDGSVYGVGSDGFYWSSSLHESYPRDAWYLIFYSSHVDPDYYSSRMEGFSVRPVLS